MYRYSDPRGRWFEVLEAISNEALNSPLHLTHVPIPVSELRKLLELRPCRAWIETENHQVVYCSGVANHDNDHYAGFNWKACGYRLQMRYGSEEPWKCTKPAEHRGRHDFGWGDKYDYSGRGFILRPGEPTAQAITATSR